MRTNERPRAAEDIVRSFYDGAGWREDAGGSTIESLMFRQFPAGYADYAQGPINRLVGAFGACKGRLLVVGCGDMPSAHIKIAQRFDEVQCLDISATALAIVNDKIGGAIELTHGSILNSGLADNSADAVLCAHVLYHIDREQQERAVREMLRITRPGGAVVILYANPRSPFALPGEIVRGVKLLCGLDAYRQPNGLDLYYHAEPLNWWRRFADDSDVSLHPNEAIGSRPARASLRRRELAVAFYRWAAKLEMERPGLALRLWQYPMAVLKKRA
jgi:SAM-dependent methyltransferase